jgi:hypothetical protein
MNVLTITPDQYRGDVVHFTDRVFNASNESAFSRITYCDDCVMIAGISVLLSLSNVDKADRNCRSSSSKIASSCYASYNKKNAYNLEITRNIQYIEQDILKQYGRTFDIPDKPMCLNVSDSLMRGKIKIANCDNNFNSNNSNNSKNGGEGWANDGGSRDGYGYGYGYGYEYEYEYDDRERDNDRANDNDNDDNTSDKSDDFQSHRRISNIVLKISGIWETEFEYGLTYKYYY